MRIIRTLTPAGEPVLAELLDDGRAWPLLVELAGGPAGRPQAVRTGQPFVCGPLLCPVDSHCVIGIAQNYRAHALEMGGPLPQQPVFFIKLPGAVCGPGAPIHLPRTLPSTKVDFEAELAVVLGKPCRDATPANALDHVLGYCCANDVTARDWQKEWGGGQFCRGKGFDTFAPIGPWIVTADAVPDPDMLAIRGLLNGELMQQSSTSDLIFNIRQLICFLSGDTTLPAGTVILTGTPSGVGTARTPPRYLQSGDVYTVEIEGLGSLVNPVA
jgi:2-keto-4-pentenoate hydratase/2-oxohepta-3-ene-1,7-dioic acid hydratase in catechol pathway